MLLNDATTICKKAQTLTYLHTFRLVQFSAQNPKPGRNTKFFKLYISYISYRGFPGDFPRSSKKKHHIFSIVHPLPWPYPQRFTGATASPTGWQNWLGAGPRAPPQTSSAWCRRRTAQWRSNKSETFDKSTDPWKLKRKLIFTGKESMYRIGMYT